jgi:hypothetical protein
MNVTWRIASLVYPVDLAPWPLGPSCPLMAGCLAVREEPTRSQRGKGAMTRKIGYPKNGGPEPAKSTRARPGGPRPETPMGLKEQANEENDEEHGWGAQGLQGPCAHALVRTTTRLRIACHHHQQSSIVVTDGKAMLTTANDDTLLVRKSARFSGCTSTGKCVG